MTGRDALGIVQYAGEYQILRNQQIPVPFARIFHPQDQLAKFDRADQQLDVPGCRQVDRFDDVRDVVQGERKPIEKGTFMTLRSTPWPKILKTNGMDLKQRHC